MIGILNRLNYNLAQDVVAESGGGRMLNDQAEEALANVADHGRVHAVLALVHSYPNPVGQPYTYWSLNIKTFSDQLQFDKILFFLFLCCLWY